MVSTGVILGDVQPGSYEQHQVAVLLDRQRACATLKPKQANTVSRPTRSKIPCVSYLLITAVVVCCPLSDSKLQRTAETLRCTTRRHITSVRLRAFRGTESVTCRWHDSRATHRQMGFVKMGLLVGNGHYLNPTSLHDISS